MQMDPLKYFKYAKELNKKHDEGLRKKKLHFRGNLNSFSLVSLDPRTPEVGISNLKSIETGSDAFLCQIGSTLKKGIQRSTPEKALQAWIIDHALNNDNILPFGEKLTFLTSELALSNVNINSEDKIGKLVNDILAIDDSGILWVIELKSDRLKTELTKQVDNFISVIESKCQFFTELVKLLSGKDWEKEVRGMVVWPLAHTSPLDWGDIKEVCYQQYCFTSY